MRILKKINLPAVLGLTVGVALFLGRELFLRNQSSHRLEQRVEKLEADSREMRAQRDDAVNHLVDATMELQSLRALATAGSPEVESSLEAWLSRVQLLKNWLEKLPDKRIPQMELLTEDDWLEAAKHAKVDTELGAREALATLRRLALDHFSSPMQRALERYAKENAGRFPTDPRALAPYFEPEVPIGMLENFEYGAAHTGNVRLSENGQPPSKMISNKSVDDIYDVLFGWTDAGSTFSTEINQTDITLAEGLNRYRATYNGQIPREPAQLTPFLSKPVNPEYLQQFVAKLQQPSD